MADDERTPDGQPILRHGAPQHEGWVPAPSGDEAVHTALEAHIHEHLGPVRTVYHELVSHLVHIDVHIVEPTERRPYWTLVTTGMSDLPMTVPAGCEDRRHAELMVTLPADWPLFAEGKLPETIGTSEVDPPGYWPVRFLKHMARFPHEYGTWLGAGHSIPNGQPAQRYVEEAPFTGIVLMAPASAPEIAVCRATPDVSVHFYALWFVTTDEMNIKLREGAEGLLRRFAAAGVSDVLDVRRPSVAARRRWWWPFGG